MNEVYKSISKEIRQGKFLREMANCITDKEKAIAVRKQQDKLYKKTEFKKKFLEARSEANDRQCS